MLVVVPHEGFPHKNLCLVFDLLLHYFLTGDIKTRHKIEKKIGKVSFHVHQPSSPRMNLQVLEFVAKAVLVRPCLVDVRKLFGCHIECFVGCR